MLSNSLAGTVGIEPTTAGLEPTMIPFHHVPMVGSNGVEPFPEGAVLQTACQNRWLLLPMLLTNSLERA